MKNSTNFGYLKKFSYFLSTILSLYVLDSNAQSSLGDCAGAIEVCGNGKISSNATGFGVQEVDQNNSCASMEHNSLWIKIEITTSGTLGFTLTPTNSALEVDYDFFVFGPGASCGNLGNSTRCSTTNPNAAGLSSNITGMRDSETDLSEGPGSLGNGFVKSLDVQPGETYYIVIDRPIGQSPFELEWTGTATTGGSPFPEGVEVNQPQDLELCGSNGTAEFNIFQTRQVINDQPNTSLEYYSKIEDAIDQTNELHGNFISHRPRQTIFVRVENQNTGCFQIVEFNLIIPESPPITRELTYKLCDFDESGTEIFNLDSQTDFILDSLSEDKYTIDYFGTLSEANSNTNPLSSSYSSSGEKIYARVEEKGGPGCFSTSEISLILTTPIELTGLIPDGIDFKITSRTITFQTETPENFEYSLDNPSGPYQEKSVFTEVNPGSHILYIRGKNLCELTSIEVVVPEYSHFFTPNNDGHNDRWRISTGNYLNPDSAIHIFDRYGKILEKISPNTPGWDGTFDGRKMPADDYWFLFELPVGKPIKAHFSLIR